MTHRVSIVAPDGMTHADVLKAIEVYQLLDDPDELLDEWDDREYDHA